MKGGDAQQKRPAGALTPNGPKQGNTHSNYTTRMRSDSIRNEIKNSGQKDTKVHDQERAG
ncbi:hypothetical protein SBF1_9610004 [Candidatus Desulfosporosinus infrequens]|uniref:Uncharacterized protein n=1 Tax=Candidatus Desulfosporosinus infrequens TaxID=2043169 RepID=A0A2U3LYY1_9FIRM|nr:hypothetical protein SBF1_9610004 [Candidatus Desulfosporosinus infrequens]